MALTELALLTLALNLAVNPSPTDIQRYQSLNQADQIKIQQLIEQKDVLPEEIEKLKEKGASDGSGGGVNQSPTMETTM